MCRLQALAGYCGGARLEQSIRPQSKVDCLGPADARVERLLVHALREIADGLLGDAILEVRIYASKCELLLRVVTCLWKGFVVELPIIAVVVEDFYSAFGHILLKGKLGGKCLCQQIVVLKVTKAESAEMVDKHGDAPIALLGEFPVQLHIKPHFSGCHLVNRDTVSWLGGNENFVISLGFLALPGKLRHCPKKAACALGWQNLGELLWDLAIEGKLLELGKAQVAKMVVLAHELSLIVSDRKLDVFSFFCWR
jgi:hypothetical protein